MEIFRTSKEMQAWSKKEHAAGRKIAFVPTMGALHDGHLSLLKHGKNQADKLVLSIYVNPAQFGQSEDLSTYPRDIDGDLAKAKGLGTDAVFLPDNSIMYPPTYQTYINVQNLSKNLCGISRPKHFQGVATVVLKLFNIVQPDVAIFGEKDFQQLAIIRQMTKDLNLQIKIIGMPIVREEDGLAMSSRNRYLSKEQRQIAFSIPKALSNAKKAIFNNPIQVKDLQNLIKETLHSSIKIDYIKICDPTTLEDLTKLQLPALIALAVYIENTRLLDNCIIRPLA